MNGNPGFRRTILCAVLAAAVLSLAAITAMAVPFRPDVLEQIKAEGRLPGIVEGIEAAADRGMDRHPGTARGWLRPGEDRQRIPDRQAVVILVDFSDNQADWHLYPQSHYEELLFSVGSYPTGSMRDWYLENSYGAFNVTGEVTDWLRMPETYAYYVNGQAGFGNYPRNAQKLAEEAVMAADAFIDFSQYDNDGPDGIPNSGDDDGYVDAIFVVHAGPGREETGSDDDIHSHAGGLANPVSVDGVTASGYSMEPDNGKIGVFGHEFGHVLGLPDLYDTDYSSSGIGSWGMMSHGSWGGGGLTPVHFVSWCKAQLGFLEPITPVVNTTDVSIPHVASSPTAYRLWTAGYPQHEYFMVENRQREFFDASLPGDGLIICHVDESVSGNQDELHPLVAIEQADGLNELAQGGGSDSGDPWPGSTDNRNFTDTSNPNSRDYSDNPTQVAVRNISDSAPVMSADLEVENAPLLILDDYWIQELSGNGDGDIDPGEQWDMPVALYNRGLAATQVTATLSSSEPDVTIQGGASDYGTIGEESDVTGEPPFRATLGVGATGDGLGFNLAVQTGARDTADLDLVVGINDSLEVFRWAHENVSPGYRDQWHLSTQRNHTPDGTYAWKCGDDGASGYAANLDAALISGVFSLHTIDAVRFWHWIDAEEAEHRMAWDGGIIEVSIDGGTWEQIAPDGGYPLTIIAGSAAPFPAGTPCFSGTFDWSEERIDLSSLEGSEARIRFRFGSDGFVGGEGWFVDDVSVEWAPGAHITDSLRPETDIFLATPYPNPGFGRIAIRFTRPGDQEARLALTDASGRQLADWIYPASAQGGMVAKQFNWDGVLSHGGNLPAGAYFLRLDCASTTRTQRLLWLR